MTSLARQILIRFSLLCYFLASNMAAAHALPMALSELSEPAISAPLESEDAEVNCHSPNSHTDAQSDSATCKIFCAAMAQAMNGESESVLPEGKPRIVKSSFKLELLSHQIKVEPHPPK